MSRTRAMGWKDDAKSGERHLDAGEYVIGALNAVDRSAFEARMAEDVSLQAHARWWEKQFGILNAMVAPEAAPPGLWNRIEAGLSRDAAELPGVTHAASTDAVSNDNSLARVRRSRSRWRLGALAATIAAVAFGLVALNDTVRNQALPTIDRIAGWERAAPDADGTYVAVVNATGDQPSLIVSVTGDDISVRTLGVEKPSDKSLELWYVPEGRDPLSIGLVGEGQIDLGTLTANDGDLLAVSVEQPGGSPTGVAQGPIIYSGKLVKAD